MKFKKIDIIKILEHLDELQKKDDNINEIFYKLQDLICEDQHPNFLTLWSTNHYIDGIREFNGKFAEELEYYLEAKGMETAYIETEDGVKHNAKSKQKFANYLFKEYFK